MRLYQGTYYNVEAELYHKDPCPEPSLSASIAKRIWQESSQHAWQYHPRLNPDFEPVHKRQFDLGAAAHVLLLENSSIRFLMIEADNYRTKKAQQARNDAYQEGLIPILIKEAEELTEMVSVIGIFLRQTELAGSFRGGVPEVTLTEFSNGFWKRCRLDWLPDDRRLILDYKTTSGSSKPETWIRTQLFNMHYDIQAYAYPHILSKVESIPPPRFVWLVQENKKPYACSLVGASPSVIESGKKKWRYACHKWKWCIEHNNWPAHDSRIHWAEVPAWSMAEIEERVV